MKKRLSIIAASLLGSAVLVTAAVFGINYINGYTEAIIASVITAEQTSYVSVFEKSETVSDTDNTEIPGSTDKESVSPQYEPSSCDTDVPIIISDTVTAEETTETTTAVTTPEKPHTYTFRNKDLLNEHFEKHGISMGFANAQDYEQAASEVVTSPEALGKIEAADGDFVYYIEATNEFVILSTDGFIRTYFYPDDGKDYFERQ